MATLQRYVSKELTHFVGQQLREEGIKKEEFEEKQYNLLLKILTDGELRSSTPDKGELRIHLTARMSDNKMYIHHTVCFCDIPVNDLDIHMKKYSRFGLSFLKSFLVQKGASPVFYIAKNSIINTGNLKNRSDYFDEMISECQKFLNQMIIHKNVDMELESKKWFNLWEFLNRFVFSFMKFFDDKKPDDSEDNYYMEREWRIVGDLDFELNDVYRVILPERFAERFRKDMPNYMRQITFAE